MTGRLIEGLSRPKVFLLALATVVAAASSVFAGVLFVGAANPDQVTGTVFLDESGDVLNDGVVGSPDNPGLGGVPVDIFLDITSDGPTADDTFVQTTVTDAGNPGYFEFNGLNPGSQYIVRVAAVGIDPPGGTNLPSFHLAEQTWGPTGAVRPDNSLLPTNGPLYGGRDPVGTDLGTPGSLVGSDHVAVVSPSDEDLNFGFSFNVVTNLSADTTVRGTQGSLSQFVHNANAVTGANAMRFVPMEPSNATQAGNQWWRIDMAGAAVEVTDELTTISGVAWASDGSGTRLDSNPGHLGAGAAGGYAVGTRTAVLPMVERPELELAQTQLRIRPSGVTVPHQFALEDIAIASGHPTSEPSLVSFDDFNATGQVILDPVVQRVVLGSQPHTFERPVAGTSGHILSSDNTQSLTIQDSLIGFTTLDADAQGGTGITLAEADNTVVRGVEVTDVGGDGVGNSFETGNLRVEGSLIHVTTDFCADLFGLNSLVTDSTLEGCGRANAVLNQLGGVRFGEQNSAAEYNLIQNNPGPGVVAAGENNALARGAGRGTIRFNSIVNNAGAGIDIQPPSDLNETLFDGVTLNNAANDPTWGNSQLDYPDGLASVAAPTPGNWLISGTACPGCEVDVYLATAGVADTGPDLLEHGEGSQWLGSGTANGVGAFSVEVTAIPGDEMTATATDTAAGVTSEFSPNIGVTGISGRVFIDPNIDGEVGDGVPVPSVTVRLWTDVDPSPAPGPTDTLFDTVTTDASGLWRFGSAPSGDYWVTVDSTTIAPPAGIVTGGDATAVWAEQTHGPAGSFRSNNGTGSVQRTDAGPVIGGRQENLSDVPINVGTGLPSLAGSEHIFGVTLVDGISGLDTGFSFDVVSEISRGGTTFDADGPASPKTAQGSIRQFITNANNIAGPNTMKFVPATVPNTAGAGRNWWRMSVVLGFPSVTDAGTILDGTAYDYLNPTLVLDPAGGTMGLVDEPVGTLGATVPAVPAPELELWGDRSTDPGMTGFTILSSTSQVTNFGFLGFDSAITVDGVSGTQSDVVLSDNVIGLMVADGSDPGAANRLNYGVLGLDGAASGTIRNNLIGFTNQNGVILSGGANGFAVEQNQITDSALQFRFGDAITVVNASAGGHSISQNYISGSSGFGIDLYDTDQALTIRENTIRRFGILIPGGDGDEGGIRTMGQGTIIEFNRIANGGAGEGDGVVVVGFGTPAPPVLGLPSDQVRISQNEFEIDPPLNIPEAQPIDWGASGTRLDRADGPSFNDGLDGCGYVLPSGNRGLDYPLVTGAQHSASGVQIIATGCPGSTIELYTAKPAAVHAEMYLGSLVVDGAGNATGTISAPGATQLWASQIDSANNTSEFSPPVPIAPNTPPVITRPPGPYVAREQEPFTLDTNAVDLQGDAPIIWTLLAGPPGMTLDQNGDLAWTPGENDGGTVPNVQIEARAGGQASVQGFSVTVDETNQAPTITGLIDIVVQQGDAGVIPGLPATDPDVPANNLTWSSVGAPPWATTDPTSGAITYAAPPPPVPPAVYTWSLEVTDDGVDGATPDPMSDTTTVSIEVVAVPPPPPSIAAPPGPYAVDEQTALLLDFDGSNITSWASGFGPHRHDG